MSYTIEISGPAESDVRGCLAYIGNRSPAGAQAWRKAFEGCLDRLRTSPTNIGLAPEDVLFDEAIHQALFKTKFGRRYRCVFVIRNETVHVLRVRGPGQDLLGVDDVRL